MGLLLFCIVTITLILLALLFLINVLLKIFKKKSLYKISLFIVIFCLLSTQCFKGPIATLIACHYKVPHVRVDCGEYCLSSSEVFGCFDDWHPDFCLSELYLDKMKQYHQAGNKHLLDELLKSFGTANNYDTGDGPEDIRSMYIDLIAEIGGDKAIEVLMNEVQNPRNIVCLYGPPCYRRDWSSFRSAYLGLLKLGVKKELIPIDWRNYIIEHPNSAWRLLSDILRLEKNINGLKREQFEIEYSQFVNEALEAMMVCKDCISEMVPFLVRELKVPSPQLINRFENLLKRKVGLRWSDKYFIEKALDTWKNGSRFCLPEEDLNSLRMEEWKGSLDKKKIKELQDKISSYSNNDCYEY